MDGCKKTIKASIPDLQIGDIVKRGNNYSSVLWEVIDVIDNDSFICKSGKREQKLTNKRLKGKGVYKVVN